MLARSGLVSTRARIYRGAATTPHPSGAQGIEKPIATPEPRAQGEDPAGASRRCDQPGSASKGSMTLRHSAGTMDRRIMLG